MGVVMGGYILLCQKSITSWIFGGERGIRTLDTDLSPYASLAGKCLRPLGQLSVLFKLRFIARARYYLKPPYKSIRN
jgi:hypothetical protein